VVSLSHRRPAAKLGAVHDKWSLSAPADSPARQISDSFLASCTRQNVGGSNHATRACEYAEEESSDALGRARKAPKICGVVNWMAPATLASSDLQNRPNLTQTHSTSPPSSGMQNSTPAGLEPAPRNWKSFLNSRLNHLAIAP
jgi:hypothetical protein